MNTGSTVFTNEEWRPVPAYPGYEASSEGRIRSRLSYKSQRMGAPVILGGSISGNGYPRVSMTREDGVHRYIQTHRIIAEVFCPRLPGQDIVRHLNDNRNDCRASNLAWGTRNENAADAIANGKISRGIEHSTAFVKDEDVREIYLSSDTAYAAAKKYGVSASYVSNIRTGRTRRKTTADLGLAPGAVGMGGYNRGRGRTITKEQAIAIYTGPEPHSLWARRLGISMTHVLRIRQGVKWRSVTEGLAQPTYERSAVGVRVNADGSLMGRSISGEQAIEIFMSPERGRDIAARLGISESLVSTIRKRGQWGHLTKGLTPPPRPLHRKHRKPSQDLALWG